MERRGLGTPIVGFIPTSPSTSPGRPSMFRRPRICSSGSSRRLRFPSGGPTIQGAEWSARLPFEIVRSCFARRVAIDLPSFVSDASGFHTLVVGDAIPFDRLHWFLAGLYIGHPQAHYFGGWSFG